MADPSPEAAQPGFTAHPAMHDASAAARPPCPVVITEAVGPAQAGAPIPPPPFPWFTLAIEQANGDPGQHPSRPSWQELLGQR